MAKQQPKPTGYVVYDGPSRIDGSPVVGIVTVGSGNVKTGNMAQFWILPRDVSPVAAAHSGADAAVCGTCPHRGTTDGERNTGRACYVLLFQGPRSVWEAYQRGRYPVATAAEVSAMLAGRPVRLGAYGDPAAVPADISRDLTAGTSKRTGYTHRWSDIGATYRDVCMASVDSPAEAEQATAAGWRYFRIGANILPGEIVCPASEAAGKVTTCARCGLCNGSTGPNDRRRNIVILAHGAGAGNIGK